MANKVESVDQRSILQQQRKNRIRRTVSALDSVGFACAIALAADWIGSWNFPAMGTVVLALGMLSTLSLSYVLRNR